MTHVMDLAVLFLTLFTNTVLTDCSVGCSSCFGSKCLKCESSYYLSSESCFQCPEKCISCNGYNDCTSCKPGKWGSDSQCQFNCVDHCYNEECQFDTGYCFRCKTGLHGLQCQHNCSVCVGSLCDLRRCTQGCKQGYYEYKTVSESICLKCPKDCRHCSDAKTCLECNDGFHLYKFNSNGNNFVHCVRCTLGPICSNYCVIQNCNQCDVIMGSLVCIDCPEGSNFNGETCILNTTNCSQECSSHCDDNGVCLGSCNAGWTGETCSEKCSDRCFACDRSNSDTCQQCTGDFYTVKCDTACSPSCMTEEGKQTCRLTDGSCLNGCEHNLWGLVCDHSCYSGCINNDILVCERNNGTCLHGCKYGYIGDKCDTSKKTTESEGEIITQKQVCKQCNCKENDDSKIVFVEGFFLGLGTSVVVVVITVALFKIRRRYVAKKLNSQQDSNKSIETPTYYNEAVCHTHEAEGEARGTNNYEQLGNTRNTDNVYNDLGATTVQ